MTQFFTSGSQSIGASASASVLPMNIQSWFPLGLTGLVSLLSQGTLKSLQINPSVTWSIHNSLKDCGDFPGGPVVKNPPANAGDTGSIPGLGRFHMQQSNRAHSPQLRSPHSRAWEP